MRRSVAPSRPDPSIIIETEEAGLQGAVGADRATDIVGERWEGYLERIRDLCRMPSVSATGEGVRDVADAVLQMIREAGGEAELVETPGFPVIIGEITGPPGASSLLRYGMYDVQPAEEPDWTVPPFSAEIVDLDGVGPSVVCRGVANSKGTLASFFCALDALREAGGVPVTIRFVIEGEEELGSTNLPAVVTERASDLRADHGVDLDLYGERDGSAALVLGCKGLLSLELVCRAGDWGGPARPLHSSEAAWIASPVWGLVHALAALVGPDEELLVREIVDAAAPPAEADRPLLRELAEGFDPEEHLRDAKASRYKIEGSPQELLEALIYRPTANIDGLEAGYTGPGHTIMPSEARAVLDLRLVPDLDPDEAAGAVRRHLDREGFGHVEVRPLERYPWAKAAPDSRASRAMRASYERLGRRPLPYPMAPWCAPFYIFDRLLDMPWASGGLGFAGGAHAPDEFATVEGLREHTLGTVEFLLAYAEGA
ncbi:MAG TPA: M20/M25/M40 family metallo-hydrolase [Actinomycetota bacterium]|nr:M20/M25/M40 family metallo-hydrolase [Actinomycetota bacterium]